MCTRTQDHGKRQPALITMLGTCYKHAASQLQCSSTASLPRTVSEPQRQEHSAALSMGAAADQLDNMGVVRGAWLLTCTREILGCHTHHPRRSSGNQATPATPSCLRCLNCCCSRGKGPSAQRCCTQPACCAPPRKAGAAIGEEAAPACCYGNSNDCWENTMCHGHGHICPGVGKCNFNCNPIHCVFTCS